MADGGATDLSPSASLELIIQGRARDLGGFVVRRTLPAMGRRLVGPFIFFDHLGPVRLPPGAGIDVRPHPHIGLATVTFLFEGEIVHRDSLGSRQPIRPGDVNWMLAGRGIVDDEHAERAVYVVEGTIAIDGRTFGAATMAILAPGVVAEVTAQQPARLMLIGGAPLDGARFIDWNFVSSDKEQLQRAKAAWRADDTTWFPKVPGDERERIPAPDR